MYLGNIYIRRNNGAYVISSSFDYEGMVYIFYSKKEALKRYKETHGLKYQRGIVIYDYTKGFKAYEKH